MLLISHRGNLNGPNPELENSEAYIEAALVGGFDVETDVWSDDNGDVFLGHDNPTYKTSVEFLSKHKEKLWIHCKNLSAINMMLSLNGFNFFWHQNDDYTLTSKKYIWTYPNKKVSKNNVLVVQEKFNKEELPDCLGVCSDYVGLYK